MMLVTDIMLLNDLLILYDILKLKNVVMYQFVMFSLDQLMFLEIRFHHINEDLIITGGHSILVDDLSEEEMEESKKYFGSVLLLDDKYKLLACIDKNATIYDKKGIYDIYHLALESDDEEKSFGIYANGMLVESCSLKYLKEQSNMNME